MKRSTSNNKRAGFNSSADTALTMSVSGNVQTVVKSIGVPDVRTDSSFSWDRTALTMTCAGNSTRKQTQSRPLERMESCWKRRPMYMVSETTLNLHTDHVIDCGASNTDLYQRCFSGVGQSVVNGIRCSWIGDLILIHRLSYWRGRNELRHYDSVSGKRGFSGSDHIGSE